MDALFSGMAIKRPNTSPPPKKPSSQNAFTPGGLGADSAFSFVFRASAESTPPQSCAKDLADPTTLKIVENVGRQNQTDDADPYSHLQSLSLDAQSPQEGYDHKLAECVLRMERSRKQMLVRQIDELASIRERWKDLCALRVRGRELEARADDHLIHERYEEAEAVYDTLVTIRDQLVEKESSLSALIDCQILLLDEGDRTWQSLIEFYDKTEVEISSMSHRDTSAIQRQYEADMNKLSKRESEVASASENIENTKRTLAAQEEKFLEKKSEVESQVKEATESSAADREIAVAALGEVDHQIADLESQLEARKAERVLIVGQLEDADAKIEELTSQYSQELQELRDEQRRLEQLKTDIRMSREEADTKKAEVLQRKKSIREEYDKQIEALQDLKCTRKKFQRQKSKFQRHIWRCDNLGLPSVEFARLRDAQRAAEDERLQMCRCIEQDKANQNAVIELRVKLETANSRIPQLEESKKIAVSGRAFKEAAALTRTLKEVQVQCDDLTDQIAELTESLSKTKEDLSLCREREAAALVEVVRCEDELDKTNERYMLHKIKSLGKLHHDIKDESDEIWRQVIESLLEEIGNCQASVDFIREKIGGSKVEEGSSSDTDPSGDEEASGGADSTVVLTETVHSSGVDVVPMDALSDSGPPPHSTSIENGDASLEQETSANENL